MCIYIHGKCVCVCVCIGMHVDICVCESVSTCMYVHAYACMCVLGHACVNVCEYECVCVCAWACMCMCVREKECTCVHVKFYEIFSLFDLCMGMYMCGVCKVYECAFVCGDQERCYVSCSVTLHLIVPVILLSLSPQHRGYKYAYLCLGF